MTGAAHQLCRFCRSPLNQTVVDLGLSPLCESVRRSEQMDTPEIFYPLHVLVCNSCWLVQLKEYVAPAEIFSEYAYFSSMSDSWVAHAKKYAEDMIARFHLDGGSRVVEIASNDGYLLQHFARAGIPTLGIEPAANIAAVAKSKGIDCVVKFFGSATAQELSLSRDKPNLLIGNNVLAHVPDLNDFVEGLKILLADDGVITMEFPHLVRLMEENQFDTIYHEHFSYLSLTTVEKIFAYHGLRLFDVQELSTHGGSLRIFATHDESAQHYQTDSLQRVITKEHDFGITNVDTYRAFAGRVQHTKFSILKFLLDAKLAEKKVVGYGAPGKGVTLLNYCGIRQDLLEYTVDRNQYKQGTYVPGTGIAICAPERIFETKPDFVLILPWNLKKEIVEQMQAIRSWGGKFVVPIPHIAVLD
ncbi:MAG: class I SAM-dependent methyltransferase [Planctomycetales bacterium]|nr:class I SAM-dependent methyltransferase [Planctomycetales bacterium]